MTHAEQVGGGQENEESYTQLGRTTGGRAEVQKKLRQGKFLVKSSSTGLSITDITDMAAMESGDQNGSEVIQT